jgi:hypothetical protein
MFSDLLPLSDHVLDNPEYRRQVLGAFAAPLLFMDLSLPIRTDASLNYSLGCYFTRGKEWIELIALCGGNEPTLEELLDGYEFHAFSVQGQWHLDLLKSEHFCTQFTIRIEGQNDSHRTMQIRLPRDWQSLAERKTLELLSAEIERFQTALGEWFDEVKEEIGDWLAKQYEGLNPTKKGFVKWFGQHQGILNFRLGLETLVPGFDVMSLQFEERTVEAHFEPLIHRYCQARLQTLHADHQLELKPDRTTPARQETGVLTGTDSIRPLFNADAVYDAALALLLECRPPLISQEGYRWVGKRGGKSALIAWVEVLEQQGLMRKETSRTLLAHCLMNTFPDLTMDTSHASLWEKRTEASGKYELVFKSLLRKSPVLSASAKVLDITNVITP